MQSNNLLTLASYIMGLSESSIITILIESWDETPEDVLAVYQAELDRRHRAELLQLAERNDHIHLAWISEAQHPFNIDPQLFAADFLN
jgi:hypothetical protein